MTDDRSTLGTVWLVSLGAVFAGLLSPDQWLAWLLLGLTLILPLASTSIRDDYRLTMTVYLVIACHHGLAVLVVFEHFRPLDLWDAFYFDHMASQSAQVLGGMVTWELGFRTYVNILKGVYLVNDHFFVGAELSILFAVAALLLTIEIAREIKVPKEKLWWVAVAGLIPGSLIFFSVTYRESCQLFFLVVSVWAAIRMLNRGEVRWWALFAAALVCMGILHKALAVYLFFMILLMMVFMVVMSERSFARWGISLGILSGVVGVIVWVIPEFVGFLEPFIRLIDLDGFDRITTYRERMVNHGAPRTAYKLVSDWSDLPGIVTTLGSIYLHYLFAPFNGITRWIDLYAIAEAWMRFVLMAVVGVGFFRVPRGERRLLLFLLIVYLSLTLLCSMGTTNYGQALRHHTMTNWVLFILFTAVVSRTGRLFVGLRRAGRAI